MDTNWKKRLTNVLLLLLAGFIILPVCAYLVGQSVVGPYEGDSGIAGYLATLYASAWRGDLLARLLLLTPLLLAVVWMVALKIYRHGQAAAGPDAS